MPTSASDPLAARAVDVKVTDDELTVQLEDGRTDPLMNFGRQLFHFLFGGALDPDRIRLAPAHYFFLFAR